MPIIECIPNVSEGRRPEVVDAIADAIRSVPGVRLLDYSSDASHNRSVFTMAGEAGPTKAGVLGMYQQGNPAIGSRTHKGEHPLLCAVHVSPFVPIEGGAMGAWRALSIAVGREIG